jgi:hypothetical protein
MSNVYQSKGETNILFAIAAGVLGTLSRDHKIRNPTNRPEPYELQDLPPRSDDQEQFLGILRHTCREISMALNATSTPLVMK